MLVHARYYLLNSPSWPLANALLRNGASGVDLFFIISGFIMVYTTRDADGTAYYALKFFIKRFARIWPTYAVLVFAWMLFASTNVLTYWPALLKTLCFIPLNPLTPPYFDHPHPAGWTLLFEAYFYLFFGATLLVGPKVRWPVFYAYVLFSLLVLPFRPITFDVAALPSLMPASYLSIVTSPFIWEFAVGVTIALLYFSPFRIEHKWSLRILVCATSVWAWWSVYYYYDFSGILKWGFPLSLWFLSLAIASKTINIRFPILIVWLGDISYSLYLVHPITQQLTANALSSVGAGRWISTWLFVVLSTFFAIPVAWAANVLLEKRLSNALRRVLTNGLKRLRVQERAEPAPT